MASILEYAQLSELSFDGYFLLLYLQFLFDGNEVVNNICPHFHSVENTVYNLIFKINEGWYNYVFMFYSK